MSYLCRRELARDQVGIDGSSPLPFEPIDGGPTAREQSRQAIAEVTGDDDQDAAAWFGQIRHDGFHAGGPGARDGQGLAVDRGAKDASQTGADVVEDRDQIRIQVRAWRGRQGRHHARRHGRRAGAEQEARCDGQGHWGHLLHDRVRMCGSGAATQPDAPAALCTGRQPPPTPVGLRARPVTGGTPGRRSRESGSSPQDLTASVAGRPVERRAQFHYCVYRTELTPRRQ